MKTNWNKLAHPILMKKIISSYLSTSLSLFFFLVLLLYIIIIMIRQKNKKGKEKNMSKEQIQQPKK